MRTIEIFRLRRVRDKPRALALLQAQAELAPAAARAVLNQAAGGARVRLCLPSDEAALACLPLLAAVGFVARFADGANWHAPSQAEAAILSVCQHLPCEACDGLGSLWLSGDWAAALCQAEQLASGHPAVPAPVQAHIRRTALAAGVLPGWQGNA